MISAVTADIRLLILPFAALVLLLGIVDYRKLYLLLWATIPLSTEMEFGSVGADLPDEGLMIAITGIAILLFLYKLPRLNLKMLLHPISLVLLLHFGWLIITVFTSTQPLISLKFLAAKTWYIAAFYFMAYHLISTKAALSTWLKWLMIPILGTLVIVLIRHSADG